MNANMNAKKLAIACQGGGSHAAFTAGVLKKFFEHNVHQQYELVGFSGTSGGAICALLAWYGLLKMQRGVPESAASRLVSFWQDNSTQAWWEKAWNDLVIGTTRLQDVGVIPKLLVSPYYFTKLQEQLKSLLPRKEFLDLKSLLEKHVAFEELEQLANSSSPRLFLGAVDVLSGKFKTFDSQQAEIKVETVLASAALPTLYRAVPVEDRLYWDGTFAKNPPLTEFIDHQIMGTNKPDEIWVIRINPQDRKQEPKTAAGILDRINELTSNLSLYQEVYFIEKVNQWIETGSFSEEYRSTASLNPVKIRWITMSPQVEHSLDYTSKLSRSHSFIDKLMHDGEKRFEQFLSDLDG